MAKNIVFIGGGNMTTSLVGGLCQAGWEGSTITAVDHNADKRQTLSEKFGVTTSGQARAEHLAQADAIVLAVKPQVMEATVRELRPLIGTARPLILSIAAGIPLAAFHDWLGNDAGFVCVRSMPNTASLLGAGATGLYADAAATDEQRQLANDIMTTAGLTVWVDSEKLIDTVCATSGSGLAYYFAFMEAMVAGAEKLGLDAGAAQQLVIQTALGAARMADESGESPAQLRSNVTSKGGTTAAALTRFQEGDLTGLVDAAMQAAARRSTELTHELTGCSS